MSERRSVPPPSHFERSRSTPTPQQAPEAPVQYSTATNTQTNRNNNPRTPQSQTICPHGTTTFMQYLRHPSDGNAAAFKADSFLNHQRVLYLCNCVLA